MVNVVKNKTGKWQSAPDSCMNKSRKCLPDNLVCQDLLAGPSYLEHPRTEGILILIQSICPWENKITTSVFACITTGPMVPLVPFFPINPTSPCSPTGPVSPKWPHWPLLPWRIDKRFATWPRLLFGKPSFWYRRSFRRALSCMRNSFLFTLNQENKFPGCF